MKHKIELNEKLNPKDKLMTYREYFEENPRIFWFNTFVVLVSAIFFYLIGEFLEGKIGTIGAWTGVFIGFIFTTFWQIKVPGHKTKVKDKHTSS